MINHPYFYEEQMRLINKELKEFDQNAWKWMQIPDKKPSHLPFVLLRIKLRAFLAAIGKH
ncbi:hypothetical protein [Paenibacillus glycinis]|uniref:Uncharacterized protein n=1 Tax=Paenibacillus glycinis TaxID=2697035 RepID=A0ABW9XW14_9BACL|nr:hypothetical protein [Paenibacillus glycinis]NBD26881.1 hypothetical protein [Paenibacillus glycinis]